MNKKIIKGAMCLSMISSIALTNASLIKPINAIASQITGTTHTGSFNVDSLTLQPGETTSSVNVNWYAPEGTGNSMIQFGDQTYQVEAKDLTSPTKVDTSKYKDTGKKVCKVTVNGLQADTQYTYYISNDNGNTWSNAYTYTTPKNDSFKFGFTSDPQIKENKETDSKGWNPSDGTNQTGWATMMSELEEQGVNLVVSAGDQVEDQNSQNPDSKEIDAFTVTKKSDGGSKTTGFENAKALLSLQQTGRYDSGITNADGGVIEIVDYNNQTGWAYAVNGQSGKLVAIALKDIESKDKVDLLDGNDIDIKSIVEKADSSFVYGDMTSVSVSHDGKYLALAIQAANYKDNGRVALFECYEDGTIGFLRIIEVGVQPDMVVYTNDDTQILTANEGEPRNGYTSTDPNGYTSTDPKGTVSIINTKTFEANHVGFEAFDRQEARQKLVDQGIVIKKGTKPSEDFEPEYIAVSDTKAYITLQENNAIAIIDLKTQKIESVMSVGYEDYSKVSVDIDKKDEKYAPQTYNSLRGIRMPDALSVYTVDGVDYIVTANEGDSRKWGDYTNEKEVNFRKGETSPTEKITSENSGLTGKVVFFDSSDYDGLDNDKDYLFGGRSSTIFKVEGNTMKEVFTTGNDFEAVTAKYIPDHFNCSNNGITIDDRSGKKGPESESVTIGKIGEKTFAFVGLERVGGVVVYDITTPEKATYVNYINSRDFTSDIAGDDSPEGMKFISSEQSKTGEPQLLVAYEVSGTLGAYDLTLNTSLDKDSEANGNKPEDKKDENIIITDTNNKDNNTQDSLKINKENIKQKKVKTGDNTMISFYVITLFISLFVGVFFIKKHQKVK